MQPDVYSHSHLLPVALQLLCFKKLCNPWDSFCFLHIKWCAGWGRLAQTIRRAGTHFHGAVFAPLPHGNAAFPASRLFPLWLSMCLFYNSLCFPVTVASPPRSFVFTRGRPCSTQALKAHVWVWGVGGRRSECGKGSAERSSPPKSVWQWGGMAAVLQKTPQSFRRVQIAGETPDTTLVPVLSCCSWASEYTELKKLACPGRRVFTPPPDYIIMCFAMCLCIALSCSMLYPSNGDFTLLRK